jgi:hypothetical protein
MALGNELRDFVAGFQTGYSMFKSADEKDWEKEKREMERKRFQSSEDQRLIDNEYREEGRTHQRERDAIGDSRWEKQFERDGTQIEFSKERAARDDAYRQEDIATKREELRIKREELQKRKKDALEENDRVPRELDKHIENDKENGVNPLWTPPEDTSDEQSAIPYDDVTVQQASYDPAALSAEDNTGFNLQSYLRSIRSAESGGNDRAKNPRSTATGRYQFLSSTWKGLANKYPGLGLTDRYDGDQQEKAIRQFTYDNAKYLERKGIPINNGSLYAAHFLGADGAKSVYRASPDESISNVVGSDVIKANPFLQGMSVADFEKWAAKKGNRYSAPPPAAIPEEDEESGTLMMAGGGLVTAIPEDPMEQQRLAEETLVDDQLSLPEEQVEPVIPEEAIPSDAAPTETATPDEEPSDDMWENARRAVRDGINKSIEDLRLEEETAVEDPEYEAAYENYMKGYGAAPDQVMRQVLDKVDPDRTRPPAERNMLAMGTVYRFYMDQGEPEKAKAAANSMVQYYRTISSRFLAVSQAAAEEGDLDEASKAAIAAYANIPNGRDLDIEKMEDGKFKVSVTDAKTGKKIVQQLVEPQQFAAMAMQFDPSTFDDEIYNAAGIDPEKFEGASIEELGNVSEAITADEMWPDGEIAIGEGVATMDANRRNAFKDAAVRIASEPSNQMVADEAMRFVSPDGPREFKVENIRQNPDKVRVTRGNKTVVLDRGVAKDLEAAYRSMLTEAKGKKDEEQKSTEEWNGVINDGIDAGKKIFENEVEALPREFEKATKPIVETFTTPRTMDDVESETAIPEQTGPRKTFAQLLVEREDLLAAEQTPETTARLAEVQRILKEMGLNE